MMKTDVSIFTNEGDEPVRPPVKHARRDYKTTPKGNSKPKGKK